MQPLIRNCTTAYLIHVFLSVLGGSGYGPGDKRRKPTQLSSMTYILDESDILDDLKIINKNKAFTVSKVRVTTEHNYLAFQRLKL